VNFLNEPHVEEFLAILAGLFLVISQIQYILHTFSKKVQPSILSWLGWAVLTGTSLFSQYLALGWQWNFTGILLSTISCLVVSIVALSLKNFSLKKEDWKYIILGCICMVIYWVSENPWTTTVYAIMADFILGIPTLAKAYANPASEKSAAWLLGLISWTFSLALCIGQSLLSVLFPVYLFLFNVAMVYLTRIKKPAE
jgi:hypothetical protein